jgi:hypothetical protein
MRVLGSILIGLALFAAEPALSQSTDKEPGNAFLPTKSADLLFEGQCMSAVCAMIAAGAFLTPDYRYWVPQGVNIGQGTRVVIQFLDANPNMLHYDFRLLLLMAFKVAWPCK